MSIRRFGRLVDGAQVKSAEIAGRPMHAWRSVRKTGAVPENESPLAWREGCFYAIRRASPQTHSTAENALKGISRFYMSYCRPFASIGLFSVCWFPLVGCLAPFSHRKRAILHRKLSVCFLHILDFCAGGFLCGFGYVMTELPPLPPCPCLLSSAPVSFCPRPQSP